MKQIYCLLVCWLTCSALIAQPLPDSVKTIFNAAKTGAEKGKILIQYSDANTDNDTLFKNLIALKQYFERQKDPVAVDYISMSICRQLSRGAEYAESINELFKLLPHFEARKDAYGIMVAHRHFSYAYYAAGDKEKTLFYDKKTVDLSQELGFQYDLATAYNNLGSDLSEYGLLDSAFIYSKNAVRIAKEIKAPLLISKTLGTLGECYLAGKQYDVALNYFREVLPIAIVNSKMDEAYTLNDLSQIYQVKHQTDSSLYYAARASRVAGKIGLMNQLLRAYKYLYAIYKINGPLDSTYKYLELTINTKDSIYSSEKAKQVQLINVREQIHKQEVEQQKLDTQNKIKIYALIGGLGIFLLVGIFLYRNNHKEKKAKILLEKKNELIEQTLSDLKATQSQLVQSEKMASLGELTAGIAHEIQNPLNFVNNFSEVNKELIAELKEEIKKGNSDEVNALADDIEANEEKINYHGKRADAIVKGMLQHSRSSSGVKEATDINTLADEYLRLAYHGLRAKDKSFNATLKTDYDQTIGNINIIPQDIGRVILNLITNAFYAVHARALAEAGAVDEKKKQHPNEYDPTVWVSTKKIGDKVELRVRDNGNGIPSKVLDKIFQPFFTTKPTGQGTGLGLSLSYDIVKAHGGDVRVETEEGEGSAFIIQLPIL